MSSTRPQLPRKSNASSVVEPCPDPICVLLHELSSVDWSDPELFSDGAVFCRDIEIGNRISLGVQQHIRSDHLIPLLKHTHSINKPAARAFIIGCAIAKAWTDQTQSNCPKIISTEDQKQLNFHRVWGFIIHRDDAELQRALLILLGSFNPMRNGISREETLMGLKKIMRSSHDDIRSYTPIVLAQLGFKKRFGFWR